jgi:hypothetical protein
MVVDPSHLWRGRLVYGGGVSSAEGETRLRRRRLIYREGETRLRRGRFVYGGGDSSTERETRVQNISFDSGTNC